MTNKEKIKWRRINSFSEIGFIDSDPFSIYYRSDFSHGIIKFVKPTAIFDKLDEIRNREITTPEEQDQQEIDYQELKKKWCEK